MLGDTLTVEYATDTLARYRIAFEPDERHIRAVTEPQLFATRYPSPQPFIATLAALEWCRALRLPPYQPHRKRRRGGGQAALFSLQEVAQQEA